MNLFRLSVRNMTSRPLSTTLSMLLLTLGVGMIALLLQVERHVKEQLDNNIGGIDMVVGAKGSPLQLILSAVYHIDMPTGNISFMEAQKLKRNRLVAKAVPLSYGDSYRGYRIVGSDHQFPALYAASLSDGALWQKPFDVTLGATVARKLELELGDSFVGSHGLVEGGEGHAAHAYRVVGIFAYTNSVLDQLIMTATESVWRVHQHLAEGTGIAPDEHSHHDTAHEHWDRDPFESASPEDDQRITAMLVKFRSPIAMIQLPRMVNERTNMQAAVPVFEMGRLTSLMAVGLDTLGAIARLIMAVSGLSIFISLYTALRDRQYEMALMRSYGATRWQLVRLVMQEGLLLTMIASLLGLVLSRLGLWAISGVVEANYHYSFSGWMWVGEEVWLVASALGIGLLASLLPAIHVYRIDISKTLADA